LGLVIVRAIAVFKSLLILLLKGSYGQEATLWQQANIRMTFDK
jgi:hypothetical protein